MSAKWVRVRKWDDQHLRGPLLPVKWVLRAFSSITLAVILLIFVALYGTLASVPVGLVVKVPTLLIYALTFVATLGVGAILPTWVLARAMRRVGKRGTLVLVWVFVGLPLMIAASAGWAQYLWPLMKWRPATGEGLMLFPWVVEHYKAVQFRRLPGVEMSELEFYAWWPLSLVLVLFVVNLIVATVRRIEFIFPKVGVLTVHTGIVTIALGSLVYAGAKQEGDVILLSGGLDDAGKPRAGPPQNGFFDNTDTALWLSVDDGVRWEQRPLGKMPRYYDYNLRAVGGVMGMGGGEIGGLEGPRYRDSPDWQRDFGPLDIRVADPLPPAPGSTVDADRTLDARVKFRVVGYASYCELEQAWVSLGDAAAGPGSAAGLGTGESLRDVEVWLTRPDPEGKSPEPVSKAQKVFRFVPGVASQRVEILEGVLGVEYTRGMSEERWRDLQEPLAAGVQHALVVEVPAGPGATAGGQAFRAVYPAVKGGGAIKVGQTGYTLEVKDVLAQPPFPIITPGFQGAQSSMVIVRVTPPASVGEAQQPSFERWVYHRFPEITQEMVDDASARGDSTRPGGMPKRRDPDPGIRIAYIDASMVQVYFDEPRAVEGGPKGATGAAARAIVRLPGGGADGGTGVNVYPNLREGSEVPIAPALKMKLGARLENAIRVEVPRVVGEPERNKNLVGNHQSAAIALEITEQPRAGQPESPPRVLWVPFSQYLGVDNAGVRRVPLSDGREVSVAFGRVRHALPMRIALKDFEMIPYPNSDTPRDYRSDVVVTMEVPGEDGGTVIRDEVRKTSLNEPLLVRVPFRNRDDVPMPVNWIARAASLVIPTQYKFAQAGWDMSGWRETQARAEAGELPRPVARYTILGVGNNPGIYVIAAGAVMMSVGIPWAFYLKPILMRRRKRKLQMQLAKEGRLPAHLMHEIGLIKQWPPVPEQGPARVTEAARAEMPGQGGS